MNLNLTLLGQMITFLLFVWFTMKFVWPPITKALSDRQKNIVDGLEAAEEGRQALANAEQEVGAKLREAKEQVSALLEQAHQRADKVVAEAKDTARSEGERLIERAQAEINQQVQGAKDSLRQEVANLAMVAASQILSKEITKGDHDKLVADLAAEL